MNADRNIASKVTHDWITKDGECRLCGGELPQGHSVGCYVFVEELKAKQLVCELAGVQKALGEKVVECDGLNRRVEQLEAKLTEIEELHAFELSPAMVQARNDQLNDRVKQLEGALENAKAERNRAAQEERLRLLPKIQLLLKAGDAVAWYCSDDGAREAWAEAKEEIR